MNRAFIEGVERISFGRLRGGLTVNRLCGSSLAAAPQASRAIECGDVDPALVGGVESMTRVPWVLPQPGRAFPFENADLQPERHLLVAPTRRGGPLGRHVRISQPRPQRRRDQFSRQRQDAFALRPNVLAASAWDAGSYGGWDIDPAAVNRSRQGNRDRASTGASVGRILGMPTERMRVSGVRWGVAATFIGVRQGLAVVLEDTAADTE
jgi:acetyl-CoA acetyltransferase